MMLATTLRTVQDIPSIDKRIPETSQGPQGSLIELKRAQFKENQPRKVPCIIIFNGKILSSAKTQKKTKYIKQMQEQSEEESSNVKKNKIKKIRKTRQSDPDYSVKNQKKDRNVVSNLVHHFFRYLSLPKTQKDIQRIIQAKQLKVTGEEIQDHIKMLGNKFKTYISEKHLSQLWQIQSQDSQEKNYVLRCLIFKFFRKDIFLSISDSNKLNRVSKHIHYKGRRQLLSYLIKGGIR